MFVSSFLSVLVKGDPTQNVFFNMHKLGFDELLNAGPSKACYGY